MASIDSKKVYNTIAVDPNFPKPPGVQDFEYQNIEEIGDTATIRSNETGEVVDVNYDEESLGDVVNGYPSEGDSTPGDLLYPPDSVSVISQNVRMTTDGRVVVDVILDVPDVPSGTTYDIRLTKP